MSTRVLLAIVIMVAVVLLAVKFVHGQDRPADQKRRDSQPPPYVQVQKKAKAARNNSPDTVRAFTDEVFARSIAAAAGPSLKERVFRAELAFRQGRHPWISQDALVRIVNQGVRELNLPRYWRLTRGQLQLTREDIRFFVRDFAFSDPTKGQVSPDLSPAEAVFVVADLALQKLVNEEYQVEPEQWEQDARARRAQFRSRSGGPSKVRETFRVLKWPASVHPGDLSDETSSTVQGAHHFLDLLGFQR